MVKRYLVFLSLACLLTPLTSLADSAEGWGDIAQDQDIFDGRVYGYVDAYFEKVEDSPLSVDENGNTVDGENPYEFDVANLHVMFQGTIRQKYRYFVNLVANGSGSNTSDEAVAVRNAWVELPIYGDQLLFRAGKTYRKFGIYNEILDAVPTYIGVEPPELYDGDHLLLTRTTNVMLHGSSSLGDVGVNYSLSTGNEERAGEEVPIGGDISFDIVPGVRIGSSVYYSGQAEPSKGVGEGSPDGGVLPWMSEDEFVAWGAYLDVKRAGYIFQAAFYQAYHNATRDAANTLLLADAGLNPRQMERFFVGGNPDNGVNTDGDYDITTFYVRAGKRFDLPGDDAITPYVQADYYDNPETIANKDFGGDNEAGISDDGDFWKLTAGLFYQPVPEVALKVDGSTHLQDFNGSSEPYSEIRISLSYLWDLGEI